MKNLIVRSISGAVYVSLVIGSLIVSKAAFAAVLLFFNIVALFEFYRFTEKDNKKIIHLLILSTLVFVLHYLVMANYIEPGWFWLTGLIPIGIATNVLFTVKENQESKIGYALLGLFYITLPLILLSQLNFQLSNELTWTVLVALILIWVNDSFAYLSGIAFGKHRLFERISPKKSWEGFAGGIIATLVAAWFFYPKVEINGQLQWLILAGLIAVSSVIGDFIESMFKRSAGVKDSGKLIPGHGGVLDRIDSILFVAPVVFIYIQLIN